jgi:DMSO/TMAO reductase YedYZ molybdopterin-dependent catalytic subunit
MYISTHTVAHHLRQAFRKLSIASRVELSRIVIEQATDTKGALPALLDDNQPGFWENYGYHSYGDPWRQQRYAGDLPGRPPL